MSLSKRTKDRLDIAMGSKKAADALVAKLEANEALDQREKRELEIALADKKAAAEIAADELEIAADDQDAVDAAEQDVQDAQDALDALAPAVAASVKIGDITFTAKTPGAAGNDISIILDDSVLAGSEEASEVDGVITIAMQDGVSTAQQIVDALEADAASDALVSAEIDMGDENVAQAAASETPLADGADAEDDTAALADLAEAQAALAALLAEVADHKVSDRSQKCLDIALADKDAAEEIQELIEE